MRNKQLSTLFTTGALSFFLSFGGLGCLVTAFDLEVSLFFLAAVCGISALAGCLVFPRPRGGAVMLCLLALLGGYLWHRGNLQGQILRLCHQISRLYDLAYGCGILGHPYAADSIAFPVYLWGGLNALVIAWCLLFRRPLSFAAVLYALLPLVLCLVVTNTVPSPVPLFLLLFGVILLLLSQSLRCRSQDRAAALTRMLAVPVALALGLLFFLEPMAGYNKQNRADAWGSALLKWVDRIPYVQVTPQGTVELNLIRQLPETVDLELVGPRVQSSFRVMTVTAQSDGTLYLRGKDHDQYSGTAWHSTGARSETFHILPPGEVNPYGLLPVSLGTVDINTFTPLSHAYLPYYPEDGSGLRAGGCPNTEALSKYSFQYCSLPPNFETAVNRFQAALLDRDAPISSAYSDLYAGQSPQEIYLQLPEATRQWALEYLATHLPEEREGVCSDANAIAALVRTSAAYDLNTPRMPDTQTDFARWFLEESDTGYCVHYATATAVLLRAAGIPARYVEGYMVRAQAGQAVTVTNRDAHAWVEYYISHLGWIPLESTAAAVSGPAPSPEPSQPPPVQTTEASSATVPPTHGTAPTDAETPPSAPPSAQPSDYPYSPSVQPPPDSSGQDKDKPAPAAAVAVWGMLCALAQYPIRLYIRKKYLHTGTPNTRALKKWRYAGLLSRLSRQPLPEALEELTLRARFSQHTLTEEDLAVFDLFYNDIIHRLKERPWYTRLYHRFIWAAYE